MRILLPVAHYISYNTARYCLTALQALGHEARVITQAEYYQDHPDVDLFFGVDSGGPLDFPEKHRAKTAMWFIDSRHNCNPERRQPDDDTNAQTLTQGGGWVFQAQAMDWERNIQTGVRRSTWLPLAADPDVWRPVQMPKVYDVGFGGNVWDTWRQGLLERIQAAGWVLGQWTGEPEDLAQGYSRSRVGINVSSFYDTPVAYDVNMRVFEILACGIPLITNRLHAMGVLGILEGHHYLGFSSADEAMVRIQEALEQGDAYRQTMGRHGRQLILSGHSYYDRMSHALEVLEAAGIIPEGDHE